MTDLFDALLAAHHAREEAARLARRRPRCLVPGCDKPRVAEGLCKGHNDDVEEVDPLEGVEIRPVRVSVSPFFNRSEIPDPIGVES